MLQKSFIVGVLGILAAAGCATGGTRSPWPQASPLVAPYQTHLPFQGPDDEAAKVALEEPRGPVTLSEALSAALMGNPELAPYSWEVRAREARAIQAGLYFNPEVELEVEEFGGTGDFGGFQAAQTTLQLSQLIDLGGTVSRSRKVRDIEARLAGWDFESKRLKVLSETTRIFIEVLAAQRSLDLGRDMLRLAEEVHDAVTARVEAGKVSPLDGTKARVLLAARQLSLKQSESDLDIVRSRLAAMWGGRLPLFARAEGDLSPVGAVPPVGTLLPLVHQNPELARQEDTVALHRASLELEESKATPALKVMGGAQRFEESDDFAALVGLGIGLPVFDRNQGAIAEARHRLARAEAERKAAVIAAETALSEGHARLTLAAVSSRVLRDEVVPSAKESLTAAQEAYRLGKLGLLDLLDAQRTLVEVEMQEIEALASYHSAVTEVEQLIGQGMPTPDTHQEVPR